MRGLGAKNRHERACLAVALVIAALAYVESLERAPGASERDPAVAAHSLARTSSGAATGKSPSGSPDDVFLDTSQAAGIIYGPAVAALPYAHADGLVVAGRDNYGHPAFEMVADAGGTVLLYLDPVIDNPHGRYHSLLLHASECGPEADRWPGPVRANEYGDLVDFRVGSQLQEKLECVLEIMVAENPHMSGWFVDDVGSRSWFPGFDWNAWSAADQQAYRDGAIAVTRTFRRVADRHGLVFIVNGTWGAGELASDGGGYPNPDEHGNALADGGFVEHHDGEINYFGPYACSSQWARESGVTQGRAMHYAVTHTTEGLREYVESGCYAFVNRQSDYNPRPVWTMLHEMIPLRWGVEGRTSDE